LGFHPVTQQVHDLSARVLVHEVECEKQGDCARNAASACKTTLFGVPWCLHGSFATIAIPNTWERMTAEAIFGTRVAYRIILKG
jgi:hypothetical protein